MKRNAKRIKSRKKSDYMSSLPDDLLLHILSFLSTTDSVATCVLSRRWLHLWEHLEVLNFDDQPWSDLSPFKSKTHPIDFIKFVNQVFNRKKQQRVQKFYLFCRAIIVDTHGVFATWICKVLGPHLQEMSITVILSSRCYFFPPCILRCESLVSLHLQCREMHVDEKICNNEYHLASLKKLVLKLGSGRCITSLLSCCPNLETLELDFHLGIILSINISMLPSLKSLTLLGLGHRVRSLTINTPLLEYLNINLQSTWCNTLSLTTNLHNLLHVHLNILHRVRGVVDLLSKIYMAQALTLNVSTIKYFQEAWRMQLPEFHRLVRLELIVNYLDSSFVMDVFQHCCVLEFLHIHSLKWKHWKKKRKRSRALPSVAPSCVESQLKEVEFRGYCDTKEERAFVAYILERGLVLKKMKILHGLKKSSEEDIGEQRQHILNTLSTLPISSNTCQLLFD